MIVSLVLLSMLCAWANCYIFPCYYYYDPAVLKPESIPLDICTHIIFLGCVTEENLTAEYIKTPYNCSHILERVSNLKKRNNKITLILSMGTMGDAMHKIVAQNDSQIEKYVDSVVEITKKYGYQGVDFDWEFPCDGNDRFQLTKLFRMLRKRVGSSMTISAAIGAGVNILRDCYDINGLVETLDYINVMCYNYNTIYNTYTAYTSPLFARPEEKGYDATLNTNFTINYLLERNVPREKIVLGLSTDGHSFQLADLNDNRFHAKVKGIGVGSGWTIYPQLCELVRNGGKLVYDEVAEALYAYYDDQWLNAGGVRSAVAKAKYVKEYKLAGMFTWCINEDDLYNVCGHDVKFPVHRAIADELFGTN